jgi:Ankyrin repeats (3 copies)
MALETSFRVETFKDRASIGTATISTASSDEDEDFSESSVISEILEEDLLEFDDLEKELVHASSSVCSSASPQKSPKPRAPRSNRPLFTRALENKVYRRIQKALSCNFYHQASAEPRIDDSSGDTNQQTPDECLRVILQGVTASTFKSETWEGYFTAVTADRLDAYRIGVSQAIRANALHVLQELHAQGTPLDSCNTHGESMIHLACRLGKLEIIKFLVDVANVSIRVRDDAGRTPLHDACWTDKPNFDLVQFILDKSPELLFITDKRSFTAFKYIPPCRRVEWSKFLQYKEAFLRDKVNHSGYLKACDQLNEAQERLQALMRRAACFE